MRTIYSDEKWWEIFSQGVNELFLKCPNNISSAKHSNKYQFLWYNLHWFDAFSRSAANKPLALSKMLHPGGQRMALPPNR
jgi:hypothetical protein